MEHVDDHCHLLATMDSNKYYNDNHSHKVTVVDQDEFHTSRERCLLIASYMLFLLMGISSWLPVNALYLQMPFYYRHLYPYALNINSGISFSIVAASIFPTLFMILSKRFRLPGKKLLLGILVIGVAFCVLFGIYALRLRSPSVAGFALLLFGSFMAGAVGSMSNVLFWPFAVAYNPTLLNGLSLGTSFSAVVPVVVSLIQSADRTAVDQEVSTFFFVMSAFAFLSVLAFIAIERLPFVMRVAKEYEAPVSENTVEEVEHASSLGEKCKKASTTDLDLDPANQRAHARLSTHSDSHHYANYTSTFDPHQIEDRAGPVDIEQTIQADVYPDMEWWQIHHSFPVSILTVQFVSCLFHFFLLGINSYLVPHSADYNRNFTIMLRCGMLGNPIGRILCIRLTRGPHKSLLALQIIVTAMMFICGRPGAYSVIGLFAMNTLEGIVFGMNNTLVYQGAASGVHMENTPLLAGGPLPADNYLLSTTLGFIEQ
eukprot:Ihof_evm1s475 gene=Ihof_evmTU1s475